MISELRSADPVRVGPYLLLGRLGTGGMGRVYLARSPGGRMVAIKVIRPELAEDGDFRTRFALEVAAARNVSGLFTAAVLDADPEAELPWMATAYVPGATLAEAVDEHGPLPADAVISLAAGLAEGLQAIHQAGLVHRDLKPSNVLLASDGPRVIDFGISRAWGRSRLTETGMVVGSPGFLSPEQARGAETGPASDVFSLGAVLTFAASGQGPFGTGPTPGLLFRVVHEPPDLARVPEDLRPLLDGCLAKKPDERPTPAQVLDRLSEGLGVLTPDWLPPSIAGAFSRYVPPDPGAEAGPAAARGSREQPPDSVAADLPLGLVEPAGPGEPTAEAVEAGEPVGSVAPVALVALVAAVGPVAPGELVESVGSVELAEEQHGERPTSVATIETMLRGAGERPASTSADEPAQEAPGVPSAGDLARRWAGKRWLIAATAGVASLALAAGVAIATTLSPGGVKNPATGPATSSVSLSVSPSPSPDAAATATPSGPAKGPGRTGNPYGSTTSKRSATAHPRSTPTRAQSAPAPPTVSPTSTGCLAPSCGPTGNPTPTPTDTPTGGPTGTPTGPTGTPTGTSTPPPTDTPTVTPSP